MTIAASTRPCIVLARRADALEDAARLLLRLTLGGLMLLELKPW